MGLFSSSGGGAIRALASRTDAGFQDAIGGIEASSIANQDSAVLPLKAQAEVLKQSQDFRDPLMEQALTDGLRQKAQAEREKANSAAGVTGASRGDNALLGLRAASQGLLQHRSHFLQKRTQDISALSQLLVQSGSLQSSFSTARTGAISKLQADRLSTLASLEQAAIEMDNRPSAFASILGAAISSFAGSATGSDLLGTGIGALFGVGGDGPTSEAAEAAGSN